MPASVVNFEGLSRSAKFRYLCRLVCEATDLELVFVDAGNDQRLKLDCGSKKMSLCTYLRRNKSFEARCSTCDQRHLERAKEAASPSCYLCHAGLVDMVIPVRVGGRHIGTFMGGQALPQAPTEARFRRFLERIGQTEQHNNPVLRKRYFANPRMGEKRRRNLMELIALLAAHISELGSRLIEYDCPAENPVERAISFIHEHCGEPFSLEEVGRAAGIAPTYLSALFKQRTGQHFRDYVRNLRIQRAQVLLLEGRQDMEQIAIASGFGSYRSFSRTFRVVTGQNPSNWRLNSRSDPPNCCQSSGS